MATRGGGGAKLSRKTAGKNPYAAGGRDKFAALMAEVEEKRRAVRSRLGPGEAAVVRFVCGDGGELEAVVVGPDKRVCRYKKRAAAAVGGEGGADGGRPSESGGGKVVPAAVGGEGGGGRPPESGGGEVVPAAMFVLGGVVVVVVLVVGLVGRWLRAYWLVQLRAAIC